MTGEESNDGPARLIAGRYRLRAPIGSGGMGEVWQAYDERLNRRVAVKLMLDDRGAAPNTELLDVRRGRFLRETRIAASLEHLGIPAIHDAGTDDTSGHLYVVMQLLTGRELQSIIDETDYGTDPVTPGYAAAIGAQIASVLDEVHRHDVVHRDLKPRNIMVTPGGIIKVLDFGVAALMGSGDNLKLTQAGMTVGTPPYMAPEQALANAVGPAADVYSLGCVLFELLVGAPPFRDSSTVSFLWHHVHTPPPSLADLRSDVPVAIADLLAGMLAKEASDRPEAADVYDVLLGFANQHRDTERGAIVDFDPRIPFARPFGSTVRRVLTRPPAIHSDAPPLTPAEVGQATEFAAELSQQGQFTHAADVLTEAMVRAPSQTAADDLIFSLANVKFLAGAFREAAELFENVGAKYSKRYGADSEEARLCAYYEGQSHMELGESAAAIASLQAYLEDPPDSADLDAVERHLDALAALSRLFGAAGNVTEAVTQAEQLREATIRFRGPDDPELAEVNAYISRLIRLLNGYAAA